MYKYIFNSIILNLIVIFCISLSGCSGLEYVKNNPNIDIESDEDDTTSYISDENNIFVHICGHIKNPDVYELKSGQRVKDLIDLSGGFSEDADKDYINLARVLVDGEKIYIPSKDEKIQSISLDTDKINLNTASKSMLMSLSGIGESKADEIISYRENKGAFRTIEDIMNISGIKESGFEKIKDKICVD